MGLLFAAILLSARWARRDHALYFWAAIITMRTAATNVADAFQDFRIPFHVSVPLVLALFAASVLYYKRAAPASAGDAEGCEVAREHARQFRVLALDDAGRNPGH